MYTYLSKKVMYYKSMAPPIQWEGWLHRLIQKVDLEDWPRKLDKSSDGCLMRGHLLGNIKLSSSG